MLLCPRGWAMGRCGRLSTFCFDLSLRLSSHLECASLHFHFLPFQNPTHLLPALWALRKNFHNPEFYFLILCSLRSPFLQMSGFGSTRDKGRKAGLWPWATGMLVLVHLTLLLSSVWLVQSLDVLHFVLVSWQLFLSISWVLPTDVGLWPKTSWTRKGIWENLVTFPEFRPRVIPKEDCSLAFILKSLVMNALKMVLSSLKNSHSQEGLLHVSPKI